MVSPAVIKGTFTSDTLSATASTSGGFIIVPYQPGCSTSITFTTCTITNTIATSGSGGLVYLECPTSNTLIL